MRRTRRLLIITGAVCVSNFSWSADPTFEAVCAKYVKPGFFHNLLETLEPNKPARDFDWCMNERSRSATIAVDTVYGDRKMDDSTFRKSRDETTEVNEVRLWKDSTFQNFNDQTDASMSSYATKGRQAEEPRTKENLNTLNGFKTISK